MYDKETMVEFCPYCLDVHEFRFEVSGQYTGGGILRSLSPKCAMSMIVNDDGTIVKVEEDKDAENKQE